MSYLLKRGADYELEDDYGDKPYQLGICEGFTEIGCPLNLLRKSAGLEESHHLTYCIAKNRMLMWLD